MDPSSQSIENNFSINSKLIVDTDFTDDDKVFLEILINNFEVIAITTVWTKDKSPNQISSEIKLFLEKHNKEKEISVYIGSDRPFINFQEEFNDPEIFCPYSYELNSENNNREKSKSPEVTDLENIASVKITDLVKKNENNISIISTGPLTNLALSLLLSNDLVNSIANVFIVGGSNKAFGNSGSNAEYNIRCDPIAAFNFLRLLKPIEKRVWLLTNDIELDNREMIIDKLSKAKIEKGKFISNSFETVKSLTPIIDGFSRKYYSNLSVYLGIILKNPKIISLAKFWPTSVDMFGRNSRGYLLVDEFFTHNRTEEFISRVNIIEKIDVDLFVKTIEDY